MSRVWAESLNPYEVLELENGPQSSDAEIKKAYRRLAKLKHPDKNPKAKLEEFHLIQSAYEILCDAAARAAYDAVLQARQLNEERWQRQSEKRRRMREDLEAKERASTAEKRTEATALAALHAELQRLRKELETKHQTKTQASRGAESRGKQDLINVIKLKWTDPRSTWDEDRLRGVLANWATVQTVAMRRKKAQTYSAVVELRSAAEVRRLLEAQESAINSGAAALPAAAELLLFTIDPLQCEAPVSHVPSEASRNALSEAEVLAKMRRAAASDAESRT